MQSIQTGANRILPNNSDMNSIPSSGKPMSISSIITCPMYTSSSSKTLKTYSKETMERRASAPSHPYQHPQRYPSTLFRSPPTSPEDKLFESSTPSSPTSSISSFSMKKSNHFRLSSFSQDCLPHQKNSLHDILSNDEDSQPPLTLQERRLRNKAASAKYRQKKNQQQNEMRSMIGKLSEQNAVLERQLQELRLENERLKASADKLRGKMVAKKMLKKWIGRQNSIDNKNTPFPPSFHATNLNYPYSNENGFNYPLKDHDNTVNISSDQDEDDELESMDSE